METTYFIYFTIAFVLFLAFAVWAFIRIKKMPYPEFECDQKKLIRKYVKKNFDGCMKEIILFKVCNTFYTTELAAFNRCKGYYQRVGIDPDVTVIYQDEQEVTVKASVMWDLN